MSRLSLVLLVVCLAAACRQPEGPVPQPSGEQANKTEDISRDLLAVAEQDEGGVADLKNDLENLTGVQPPAHLVEDLSNDLAEALSGSKLAEESAMRLATHLFVALSARELNERQVGLLQQDVRSTLASVNVPQPKAEPVAEAVAEIQRAITTNRRRWWHRG
jgi:hypothetical protein